MRNDEYINNIESAILREKRDIQDRRHVIKSQKEMISKAEKEMVRLRNCKKVVKAHRRNEDIVCDHSDDEFNYILTSIDSGVGYAGSYCSRCGTLRNNDKYPAFEMKPTKPFKKDCEHIPVTYRDIMDTYGEPVLSIYGTWCSVCGRLYEEEK